MRAPSPFPIALLGLAGAASPSSAQSPQPKPSPPAYAEVIQVTATRLPEEAGRVPASVTVVTGEELRARGATDLDSALALVAGVDIAPGGDGGPASAVPAIWGLREFDAFLLVVDGTPWGGAFNPALGSLDLHDVERIEIQRGAAPVMYGATSFVGVIQVVHRGAAESRGQVSVGGGSFGSGGGSLAAKLPRWLGFESSLQADFAREGFRDERTSYRRGHVLARNLRVWSGGTLRLDLDGTWLDQDPASPHPREGPTLSAAVPLDANHNPEGAYLDERRLALSTGYDRPLSFGTLSVALSLARARQKAFRGFLAEVSSEGPNAHGFRETIDTTDVYFDAHLGWTGSPRWRLVAGLDHLHGNGRGRGGDFDYFVNLDGSGAPPGSGLPPAADVRIDDRRDFSGLYAFAEWSFASAWSIEAGARLNVTRESREASSRELDRDASVAGDRRRTVVRPSGTAGLTWTAWARGSDRVRLFASYRNTYKPAAIDFGLDSTAETLEPETAGSGEVGAKARLLDGALGLEVAGFLMDFDNLVVAQTAGGLPVLANAGRQRFKGLEASLVWRLARGLTARAAYSFHDARFRDYMTEFDGVATQLGGNRLEMSPHHLAAAGLAWAPERGLGASLEANWVGSRYLNKRNTALADGYLTLTAALLYRAARWEARLLGRNLGDRRDPVAESELGDAQYYRLPARRVEASATLRF